MNTPKDLQYVKTHEWIATQGDGAVRIGLTDFAQNALGELVFVNLPEIGEEVAAGEPMGDVESVKAVSDVYAPVSGVVRAVNAELEATPEAINSDPYGAWLVEVEDVSDTEETLSAEEYAAFCEEE